MRLGKGKRRLLAALGFGLLAILLILLSAPIWLPWVLKPLAPRQGLTFATYERKGYSRFVLEEVTFTNAALHFHAKQAEGLTPMIWWWRCVTGPGNKPAAFLRAEGWELDFLNQTNQPQNPESSIYTNTVKAADSIRVVRRWLPVAELSNGIIRAGKTSIGLPTVTWADGELSASIEVPDQKQKGKVHANLKGLPFKAEIQSDSAELQANISISERAETLDLQVAGLWQTNRFESAAQFGRRGALPDTASLRAADFRIPGQMIRLPEYQDISGHLGLGWTNGEFALEVAASGTPTKTSTNVPAAEVNLRARGNTNVATIENCVISSPWLRAEASPGLTVHFSGPFLQEPARVVVSANLDRQPWIKAHGTLAGEADLKPSPEGRSPASATTPVSPTNCTYPEVTFRFSGTNIGTAQVEAKTFIFEGNAKWPVVEITKAEGFLDDGSSAHIEGSMDSVSKTISSGKLVLQGPAAARWLPAGYGYENALVQLDITGPLTNLSHSGHAGVTNLTAPQLKPLQVRLDWSGQNTQLGKTEVQISSAEASLKAVFSAELRKSGETNSPSLHGDLTLQDLSWSRGGGQVFDLKKPAQFMIERSGTASNEWRAQITDFEWAGSDGEMQMSADIQWPQSGNFALLVKNVRSDVLDAFRQQPVEPAKINMLKAEGGWTNGPVVFELEAAAETTLEPKIQSRGSKVQNATSNPTNWGPVSVELRIRGDANGITITNLMVRSQTSNVAVAQGLLPLTVSPASGTNMVQLETKKPVDFSLRTEPHSVFWQKLSEWTGVVLQEPLLMADISGTWETPRGRLQMRAAEIKLPEQRSKLPRMEHFELDLGLDREVATLTNLSVLVQGQRVIGTGRIPLGEKFWVELKEKKLPNWEQATGRLQIQEAQISAFTGLFPALLAPQGTFHLDASLAPGGKLEGELALKQARTRPLPSMGPIRDIEVTMRFAGRTLKLAEATATIGGSPIMAAGEGDLSGTDWLKGAPPPFEFILFGTNVPLSRQPESIIRSDLNLAVKKTNGAPALISGTVRLRDSYYLSDLADLVPGRVSSPERRPPYFSVAEPGLADWRLAIRVGGERGLKVRSTLFNGQVSPNLRVQGTLKEPLALGDMKIENGTVKFPFASLDVQRGFVTLTSEDPYRPHLMVTAASKEFGYDVRMELTGPADEPIIQFSSTPPLSSEQLVLMVTAGQLPRGGYTLNPQQRAQTMALFLGKDLLSKLGFGDESEERLTFSSGQEISETGKPTYSLEYKLTDRWSLVGEYDRFNAFNAGIKWKVYSK